MIWAMNDADPTNENDLQKHAQMNRGVRSVILLDQNRYESQPLPANVKQFDLNITNVNVPGDYHTLYECKIIKLPNWKKHHIIRVIQ